MVLSMFFAFRPEEIVAGEGVDEFTLGRSAFLSFGNFGQRQVFRPLKAGAVTTPLPSFMEGAASIGHVNIMPDPDGTVRWETLAVDYKEEYYPSFPLQVAREYLGIPQDKMKLVFGLNVNLGDVEIPINEEGKLLIDYAGGVGTFKSYSAADVIEGDLPEGALKDKIALIGATAVGIYDLRVTPFSPVFPGVEKHANVISNILQKRFLRRPNWMALIDLASILILGVGLALLTAQVRPVTGAALIIVGVGSYFLLSHLLFARGGIWLRVLYPMTSMTATYVGITLLRLLTEERERRFIKSAFQHYVSQEVVEEIVKDPEKLKFGGERKVLSVLFSDIRDFTSFAEGHDPEEVANMLHEHLTAMVDIIFKHDGTVDKFMGDAVMAIFGAPIYQGDHALRACLAALDMIEETERLSARWAQEGRMGFKIGIGINSGEMLVGNLGSAQRFEFTVIGDNVNLASRLEAANKEFDTKRSIIISEYTYEMVRDKIIAEPLGSVTVKGKTIPVNIYQLVGRR